MRTTRREALRATTASLWAMSLARDQASAAQSGTSHEQGDMRPLDYGRSFICNTAAFNAVRFWVEGGQAARTRADGELLLKGIPPGKHLLVVSLSGKQSDAMEVQIVDGELRDAPVVLER